MTEMSAPGIPVIYLDVNAYKDTKGLFSGQNGIVAKIGRIDSEDLARNLSNICTSLGNAFLKAQEASGAFDLDEFEVTLDLAASGEARLIASVSAEIRGGLKLTFRRNRDNEPA